MSEPPNAKLSLRGRLEDLFWNVLANAVTAGLAYLGLVLFGALKAEPVPMSLALVALGLFVVAAGVKWLPTVAYGVHLPHLLYGLACLVVGGLAVFALLRGFSREGPQGALRLVLLLLFAGLGLNGLAQVTGSLASRGQWIRGDE